MRKQIGILGICASLIIQSMIFSFQSVAQHRSQSALLEQQIELHLTDATLVLALSTLAVETRIPVGLELSAHEKNDRKFDIHVGPSKLKDVLNVVLQNWPGYRWEERDGVINVKPSEVRDPFFDLLLKTKIQSFVPKKGLDKFGIRDAILDLPEVQKLFREKAVSASRLGYPYKPSIYTREVDLRASNTDVRGVLNKVVRESEHKIWVLHWIGWGNELEIGF